MPVAIDLEHVPGRDALGEVVGRGEIQRRRRHGGDEVRLEMV